MDLYLFFSVILLWVRATLQQYPNANLGSPHPSFDLKDVASVVENISKIFSRKYQAICNKTIGSLENAHSDWSPEAVYSYQDQVTIHCEDGFATKNWLTQQTISCLQGNTWSKHLPCSLKTCPLPFQKYGTVCLYLDRTKRTWDEARKNCSSLNSELESSLGVFQTADEQRDFTEYFRRNWLDVFKNLGNIWIGAHDNRNEGDFDWVNGKKFANLHKDFAYAKGQPNNFQKNQDCLAIYYSGIDDLKCTSLFPSVCTLHQ